MPDELPDTPHFGTTWTIHMIWLEAWAGARIECSECGRTVIRLVGESDYHCLCGVTL